MTTGQSIFATTVGGVLVAVIVALFSLDTIRIPSISVDGLADDRGGTDEPDLNAGVTPAPATTPTTTIDADCILTVDNSLATYYEQPGFDQLQVGSVPPGRYGVAEVRVIDFAGQQQRWFRIQVQGRAGWIFDETFFVAGKEGDCT